MNKAHTYDVMDLWLRTANHSNSFVEEHFWEKYYDFVKEKYIREKDTFLCMEDEKVIAFTCVTSDNMIAGLFVDPAYQNKGIGTEMIDFLKSEYPILHIEVYARNRKALSFAAKMGFLIDGAIRHEHNNEVMYTMLWNK
jgi:putative acetyltransferase